MAQSRGAEPGGRSRPLSRASIVDAALTLIDERGLHGFSMRGLADRLGVDPMSIYHHLRGKEAVFDGVVDRLMEEADLPTGTLAWQDWVRTSGRRFADLAEAHPNAFPLFAIRGLSSTESFLPLEALADALVKGGFGLDEVYELVQMFSNYALSLVTTRLASAVYGGPVTPRVIAPEQIPPETFPRFWAADRTNTNPRRVFERGLEALIRGLEAELRARRRPPRERRDPCR